LGSIKPFHSSKLQVEGEIVNPGGGGSAPRLTPASHLLKMNKIFTNFMGSRNLVEVALFLDVYVMFCCLCTYLCGVHMYHCILFTSYVSDTTTVMFIVFLLFIIPSRPCITCTDSYHPAVTTECRYIENDCAFIVFVEKWTL